MLEKFTRQLEHAGNTESTDIAVFECSIGSKNNIGIEILTDILRILTFLASYSVFMASYIEFLQSIKLSKHFESLPV